MQIVFRADASVRIGYGHVMRCLTLASSLRERGAEVWFVCRERDGDLCGLIEDRGFAVSRLPAFPLGGVASAGDHPSLEATSQQDSEQTLAAIGVRGARPDWLIVDHYALDLHWEAALRPAVSRIMIIDDLADRPHDCDLLLDQNLVENLHTRYADKVPATCGMLLGPEYALLHPVYAELHDQIVPKQGPIKRILISFGGADEANMTGRSLAAFLSLSRPDIELDIVTADTGARGAAIRRQAAGHRNVHLHSGLETLAPLMVKADLTIGGAGATSWERLCLGLPSLIVILAENQNPIARALSDQRLARLVGHKDYVGEPEIAAGLNEVICAGLDEYWSRRCLAVVDGKGALRVRAALTVTATERLRVRRVDWTDEALLLTWANDPATRGNAFSSAPISAAAHQTWFRNRMNDIDGCRLYILETTDCIPVGQVRFERRDERWEIDYALAPVFRGRGLGGSLLEAALSELRSEVGNAVVFGQVKSGNRPSQKVFKSLGFERHTVAETAFEYQRTL